MLINMLQVIAVTAGLVSAFYWWRSSRKLTAIHADLPPKMGDGALAFDIGGELLVYNFPEQSRLGSVGAKWAAVAVGVQALIVALSAVTPSC